MNNYKHIYQEVAKQERDRRSRKKTDSVDVELFDKAQLRIGQVLGLTGNIKDVVTPKHYCCKCHNVWYEDTTIRIQVHQVCPYCGHVWYE